MAKVKPTTRSQRGSIDHVIHYSVNGIEYTRSNNGNYSKSALRRPERRKQNALFALIQMHLKTRKDFLRLSIESDGNCYHIRRYQKMNSKPLKEALKELTEKHITAEVVTPYMVEKAIESYARKHPGEIIIGARSGCQNVTLDGPWPEEIILRSSDGKNETTIRTQLM